MSTRKRSTYSDRDNDNGSPPSKKLKIDHQNDAESKENKIINTDNNELKINDNISSETVKSNKTKYGDNRLIELNGNNKIQLNLPPKFALVTDLDNTLFPSNANQAEAQYNQYIQQFNDIWCTQYAANNCVLIYATGRNLEKYMKAVTKWDILKPDILVSKDGVSIYWFNKSLAQQVQAKSTHKIDMSFDDTMETASFLWEDSSWKAVLSEGWNQKFAETLYEEVSNKYKLLSLPKTEEVEEFRIGVLCKGEDLAKEIIAYYKKRINEYNEENKEKIGFIPMNIHSFECVEYEKYEKEDPYWSAFTAEKAGKGSAIEFLRKRLHLKENNIICIGDSGNDISMFINGYHSVIMANSSKELIKFYDEKNENGNGNIMKTEKPKTLGVIEALNYYGPRLLKNVDKVV